MSANSRHLTLAAEAFTSAVTRLRNAANRTCMSDATVARVKSMAVVAELYAAETYSLAAEAGAHLAAKVALRAIELSASK